MLTRLRRCRRNSDAGMTLTELLVGMTLLSIVAGMTLTFFVGMSNQTSRTGGESLTAADVRTAMNQVVDTLRLADTPTDQPGYPTDRFLTMTSSEVVFFSNIGSTDRLGTTARTPPEKIDIYASNNQLVEKVYRPITAYTTYPTNYDYTTNYVSTPSTTTVLLSSLGNTNVFSYCTDDTDPSQTCTPASDGESVAAVVVSLVETGARGETSQQLQSTAAITGALS